MGVIGFHGLKSGVELEWSGVEWGKRGGVERFTFRAQNADILSMRSNTAPYICRYCTYTLHAYAHAELS